MMKQKTITTKMAKILVVDLPEGARIAGIVRDHLYYYSSSITHDDYPYSEIIPYGFEDTECFQGISHITEEDWKGVVDWDEEAGCYYAGKHPIVQKNGFKEQLIGFDSAIESGLSLLKANGVMLENPLGNHPDWRQYASTLQYEQRVQDWQRAQEQVWSNPHVFIKL